MRISVINFFKLYLIFGILMTSCMISKSKKYEGLSEKTPTDAGGTMNKTISPDFKVVIRGKKINQLVGNYDREQNRPTQNLTNSRYFLIHTDLGVPFRYNHHTYLLFGDTHGAIKGNRDAMAYTTDTNPDDGLHLTFLHDSTGKWRPVNIPGITQGPFDVPMEGVEINGKMYIYSTTGHSTQRTMGRSVIARSDTREAEFSKLYDFSSNHFINVSVVKASASKWKSLPRKNNYEDTGLIVFGSGRYRKSDVYLAYQPVSEIENKNSIRYYSGINEKGEPTWSTRESSSVPLFHQPCVGELSVTYNHYINRWIMLYNCGKVFQQVIKIRTAKYPWGPWTKPRVLYNPQKDGGFCHYIHTSWEVEKCDSVHDPFRANVSGDVYGPYQYAYFAKGNSREHSTTIYFNLSTWNPYTVVLMKAKLELDK